MALSPVSASSTEPLFGDLDPRLEERHLLSLVLLAFAVLSGFIALLQAALGEESLFRF